MTFHVVRYFPTLSETFVRREVAADPDAAAIVTFGARDANPEPPLRPVMTQPHRWGWIRWLPTLLIEWLRKPANRRVLWLRHVLRRADRVHVHFAGEVALWTAEACAPLGKPWSVTVHAADLFKPLPNLAGLLAQAEVIYTISAYNQRLLRERFGCTAVLRRCTVAPSRETSRAADIIFVGRDVPKKGLDTLLRAIVGLERQLLLITDRPPINVSNVSWLGPRPHAQVLAELARARILVLPARQADDGDMDGIPVVLLEAMAAGVAVITTPVSGIPELVDEHVGWLVPPDDSDALRAAIREATPDEAQRRGKAGRRRLSELGLIV